MAKNKKITTSIIEPTEAELALYHKIIGDLNEEQLDEFATQYFEAVQSESTKSSFPKFVIDKVIRPVKPGDTIQFVDENNVVIYLFCIVRKKIEETTYLLFSMVDNETETLMTDKVYLFYVDGYDENGIEEIDVFPSGEEGERILDIIEEDANVQLVEGLPVDIPKEEK